MIILKISKATNNPKPVRNIIMSLLKKTNRKAKFPRPYELKEPVLRDLNSLVYLVKFKAPVIGFMILFVHPDVKLKFRLKP